MSTHEQLDLKYWLNKFPLESFVEQQRTLCAEYNRPFSDDWLPDNQVISSPVHLAAAEHSRRAILDRGHDLGPSSPTDVFLWRLCSLSSGPVTRIGGQPFRDPRKPWPTSANGRELPFLAQISFLDSKDISPNDLPGDVLSIYGHWSGNTYIDMNSLAFEWASLDGGQTSTKYDIHQWNFCAEGVIHRTVSYPECDDSIHELGFAVPDLLQATQIGAHPLRIQGDDDDEDGSSVFASFSSLQPFEDWPFINCPETPRFTYPKGHEGRLSDVFEMMMGDMGSLYFLKEDSGRISQSWDCY
tara:strand:- start:50 stop:946 length:897 start_codon:yes stop_codon:yes gene_type:complete